VSLMNYPAIDPTTGDRTIVTGVQTGTYKVNCDGTGTFTRTNMMSNGTVVNAVDDFIITRAIVKYGQLVATEIEDAARVPSTGANGIPAGALTRRHHTRLPDRPGPTQP